MNAHAAPRQAEPVEPGQAEPAPSGPGQGVPARTVPARTELAQAELARAETAPAETVPAETARTETAPAELTEPVEAGRERWQRRFAGSRIRAADFSTLSGLDVEPVYGPPEGAVVPGFDRIGWPGEFPFTRGLYPSGYRGRAWTIRQFSGFGNARQTNERYKMLLGAGGTGLSVAFDMPTLMGRDSDDPRSLGEVGHCGVAIDSAADMDTLFAGIPLADVTTSMTISGPAVPVFCMYLAAAQRQGADLAALDGTLQTDIFKEYIAQKEWLFPPEPHLRLIGDLMEFCAREIPAYKPLSVSGYHIREAGSTAAQELAFTLADGFGYVELGLSRGMDINTFAPGLSFFFDAHIDFFEEIAKFRAARRIWARWLRDTYGATSPRAQWLRFHTQTAGVSLTAQQPDNNVVRTAIEALAAVLGGTNSLHTNALDEVLALPSERAAEIAVRTQQVIMEETGVGSVADPLGGSWYLEALTDRLEAEAEAIFARIRAMSPDGSMTGGILRGIEDGWFMSEIAEAAFVYQQKVEKGEKKVVGVNCHTGTVGTPVEILRVSHEVERDQAADLGRRRSGRDQAAVDSALAAMLAAARSGENMIPPMLAAAQAEATLGEICDALRQEWGVYSEAPAF
jgi:methylmalonyl-CoA mutase, N-terminal domain